MKHIIKQGTVGNCLIGCLIIECSQPNLHTLKLITKKIFSFLSMFMMEINPISIKIYISDLLENCVDFYVFLF